MHNKDQEIQKILRGKYMQGPKFSMGEDLIGINFFSGTEISTYYELYGSSSIFKLIVMKPTVNLYTNHYVGKDHLLLMLLEEEHVRGGFISLNEDLLKEFEKAFSHLREEQIKELIILWQDFAYKHYSSL
jgi:hypothetical protein